MRLIVEPMVKRFGKPLPEDFENAIAELTGNPQKYGTSENPEVFEAQVQLLAMQFVARRCTVPEIQLTPEQQAELERQRREEQRQAEIAKDYAVCRALVGPESIYSKLSLLDGNTRPTMALQFLREEFHGKQNCMLLGKTGSGKTYASIVYIARYAQSARDAAFITAHKFSVAINKRDYDTLDRFDDVPYLLIDDLGVSQAGYKGEDFVAWFEDLFALRHQTKRVTIITSNAEPQQIRDTYGERFVSRFMETGVIYVTPDPDFRKGE